MSQFVGLDLTPSDSAKTLIKDGWFAETEAMWPGQKFCIEVDEVLLNGRSKFQVSFFHFIYICISSTRKR
jgi:hypothetical protein